MPGSITVARSPGTRSACRRSPGAGRSRRPTHHDLLAASPLHAPQGPAPAVVVVLEPEGAAGVGAISNSTALA
eukprot:CAMPEP_0118938764 /NCGR_PEP_ID=MMETSP1169-20130426/26998_1 /TAXON_ID=36882 /ORGANISM="Pyramimonas obovata, Strain CCMP722" /LENGTH=72 /DNA_ID=CAMNT_0006882817 /DNA_START=381 /DNA_END=596 /DNA_ORIENTATION=-